MWLKREGQVANLRHTSDGRLIGRTGGIEKLKGALLKMCEKHPFNQKVVLIQPEDQAEFQVHQAISDGLRLPPLAFSSALPQQEYSVRIDNVYLSTICSLPFIHAFVKEKQFHFVTLESALDKGNVVSLLPNGTLILMANALTHQLLGIETALKLPHPMRKYVKMGSKYLSINLVERSFLRQDEGSAHAKTSPPSKLYIKIQRQLGPSHAFPISLIGNMNLTASDDWKEIMALLHRLLTQNGSPDARIETVPVKHMYSQYTGGSNGLVTVKDSNLSFIEDTSLVFPNFQRIFEMLTHKDAASEPQTNADYGERSLYSTGGASESRAFLFHQLSSYLGCVLLDIPTDYKHFEWDNAFIENGGVSSREASLGIYTLDNGLIHFQQIMHIFNMACTRLERANASAPSLWFAICVFGVEDTPIANMPHPHGFDHTGENNHYFIGFKSIQHQTLCGILIQTINADDALTA